MEWLTDVGLGLDYHVLRLDRTDERWIVAGERLQYASVKQQVVGEVGDDRKTYTDRKSIIVGHLLDEAAGAGDSAR